MKGGVPMREIDGMDMLRYLEIYAVEAETDAGPEPDGGWTKRGTIDEIF